jgi:DNA/RNA-binding domain of Phe-tRNA-synthetase-like protein
VIVHPFAIETVPEVRAIARASAIAVSPVRVRERDAGLEASLDDAADRLRRGTEAPAATAAVRTMYRRTGVDPTRTRPSSEALLRRVRRGEPLPRVNTLVDIINWCSVESGLPFGLYDGDRLEGRVILRIGTEGEAYPGIRKDEVHLAGRLVLADEVGPFGNPTSDSARSMVTTATTSAVVVIFVPAALPDRAANDVLALTSDRIARHASTT